MNNPVRILVVDDESHITYIICLKLQQAGLDVTVACNGAEGLEIATTELPDLIISDFQMPEMHGVEMARALGQNPATAAIPIILLTARGHRIPASDLLATAVRSIMDKPFSIRDILDRIAEILPHAGITSRNTAATS